MTWDASSQGDNRLVLGGSVVTRWGGVCLGTGDWQAVCVRECALQDVLAGSGVPCAATPPMLHQHSTYLLLHADLRQNNAGHGLAVPP